MADKDRWDKFKILANGLALVAIPVVLAGGGITPIKP